MRRTVLFTCLDCGNYFRDNIDFGGKCPKCKSWDCMIGKHERTHRKLNPAEFPKTCTNCGAFWPDIEKCPECNTGEYLAPRIKEA